MSNECSVTGNHEDHVYDEFLDRINTRFKALSVGPLFTTNAEGLFDAYLQSFYGENRQYHNCHACRHFIERFGGLVVISDDGRTIPAVWRCEDAPEAYLNAIGTMESIVSKAKITGVFLTSERVLGQPITGVWKHFYAVPSNRHKALTKTASQAMAEKLEDYKNVTRALSEFTLPTINQALRLLKSDALYRSEKVIGPAQWLKDLHEARDSAEKRLRSNIVWRAVALAPSGFCHPRASMVGTLLDDIASGMDFDAVSRRFADKMHPLQYQRPQAAPSAGNIANAEKIIAQLGASGSLERRFARIEEVDALWKPKELKEPEQSGGVFGHLKAKGATAISEMNVPARSITWVKFASSIMPEAQKIEIHIPSKGDFIALVSAENMEAPPILQWDREDRRNPVSWYRYNGGSSASQWGLIPWEWRKVTAACLYPGAWFGSECNHGNEAMFVIDGAVDEDNKSLGLFPEILKSEFHGIRATVEAFSKSKKLSGKEQASACGLCAVGSKVRVDGFEYKIDRWD